jgi:hypothetical protein
MNNYIDLIILLVVSFLLFTRPNVLVNFSNTFIGKLLLILILVVTTLQSTVSGIFVAILIIVLSETVYEGMENKEETVDDVKDEVEQEQEQFEKIKDMRTKHCKTDKEKVIFVDAKGNELSLEEIQQKYPSINFSKDLCNPCDESCSFRITGTLEQLSTQDALRPKNSKQIKVEKSK